ncbi:FAD-dependent oxidoreductase, partial [bacterium]|nr:FAD-dependent oxidoreductase [bacterium]
CLGGMGTAGMVPAFMTFSDGVKFLADGFGRELLDRLDQAGGAWPAKPDAIKQRSIGIQAEALKRVYDDLLEEAGVAFTLHTTLIDVEKEGDRVIAAICAAKSGVFAIQAKIYIDGTGDADLAAWAGAPFEKGDAEGNMMPGTLCSLWSDIDFQTYRDSGVNHHQRLPDAFRDGVFTNPDPHVPGIWAVNENVGGGNIGHAFGLDSTDEASLTKALVESRRLVLEYQRFYRDYLKGFEKMKLVSTGSLMGVRESRRILGDYVLNLEDFKKRAVFPDEIGRYCYPVDIHPSKPDAQSFEKFEEEFKRNYRYAPGESYGIPYRCLLPRNLENVLVTGRCVSSDRYIQGSVRVMPGCYITGQAAGMAAAMALNLENRPRAVQSSQLRERLRRMGACLPEV